MSTVLARPTNGVSFGYRHTVTAGDASDGELLIDFQVDDYLLASTVMTLSSSGAVVAMTGAVITYPDEGQVKIENGGSYSLTEDQQIVVIAQRDGNSDSEADT